MLSEAGLPVVEATSFVSPKWVPQVSPGLQAHLRCIGSKWKSGCRFPGPRFRELSVLHSNMCGEGG